MPVKTVRKFVFSCKGEQQLSASLRFANQIAGVLKLFSLAVGVGAPAASFLYVVQPFGVFSWYPKTP